jgi:hypothetical protein
MGAIGRNSRGCTRKTKGSTKEKPSKNFESPEILFLLHFQRAKKVSTKTGMSTKIVSTKIGMDCINILEIEDTNLIDKMIYLH